MLSVLLPIYNFDCNTLVNEINEQCSRANIEFEIICIDDFSIEEFRTKNKQLGLLNKVKYSELSANIGRSKIRNLLAKEAKYNNLLFLDCDSSLTNSNFISNYLPHFNTNKIVYGGRCYEQTKPINTSEILRWKYGIERETIAANTRKQKPYIYFLTNNFLSPKTIFDSIQFNEELIGYGHEDTLFANDLRNSSIEIVHIDNPLCHIGLENAQEFLSKTEQGIKNLIVITKNYKVETNEIKLFTFYKKLNQLGLASLYYKFYNYFLVKRIKANLLSEKPSLFFFDLYKLASIVKVAQTN